MADFLSMDNILTGDEAANLFMDSNEETLTTPQSKDKEETIETKNSEDATEVDPDNLFDEEPESVGSEEDIEKNKVQEEDTTSKEDGTSPKTNFYSSIASALKEEGIFPDLDDKEVEEVKEAEDFRDLIDKQIQAGLDAVQKRINDALNCGVEPNVIRQYENTLGYLNKITDDMINEESDKGEQLRRQLLQQDFMNRGYSLERAVKMTEKLFASGEDIEEAKQALQGNKDFFQDKYDEILKKAREEEENNKKAIKKQAEQLKAELLNKEKVFGDIVIDKATRQKAYDNISKPIYKDPDTGEYYTALQKYRLEHENDFIKNVGLLFTLTDGFTNLDKLVAPKAKREVRSKLKELEHTLKGTVKPSGDSMDYVGTGSGRSGKSFFDLGFAIDIS